MNKFTECSQLIVNCSSKLQPFLDSPSNARAVEDRPAVLAICLRYTISRLRSPKNYPPRSECNISLTLEHYSSPGLQHIFLRHCLPNSTSPTAISIPWNPHPRRPESGHNHIMEFGIQAQVLRFASSSRAVIISRIQGETLKAGKLYHAENVVTTCISMFHTTFFKLEPSFHWAPKCVSSSTPSPLFQDPLKTCPGLISCPPSSRLTNALPTRQLRVGFRRRQGPSNLGPWRKEGNFCLQSSTTHHEFPISNLIGINFNFAKSCASARIHVIVKSLRR